MFKPPTQGSISGLLLAKAFDEAGIPAGVFNTITDVVLKLETHHRTQEVNFINFTGSTPIGERIGRLAGMPDYAGAGGKDAAIVLENADLEKCS